MAAWQLTLSLLPDLFAICRLPADAPTPDWAYADTFASITRTGDELSIVCPQAPVPAGVQVEGGWRCLKIEGPFSLEGAIGVVAALATPLAAAGLGIFIISTYDTDYLLIKDASLARAVEILAQAGHRTQPLPAAASGSDGVHA